MSKEINYSYDDFNKMPFFEILKLLEKYEEHMKEQQKQNEQENKQMEKQMSSMQSKYNYNDLLKQASNNFSPSNFSMPNYNINMPKI